MKRFGMWFSIFLMTAPLFKMYAIASGITMADGILVLFFLGGIFLFFQKKKFRVNRLLLLYACLVLFQFVLVSLWNRTDEFLFSDVLFRTLRYTFFLLVLAVLVPNFFQEETAVKTMEAVAVFATVWLLLQKGLLAATGRYLPGYLPGLSLSRPEMAEHAAVLFQYDPRPRSIFEEPSHYAFYMLMAMAYLLGKPRLTRREQGLLWFGGLGIILSASSTGVIALAALLGIWLFFSGGKTRRRALLSALLLLPFAGILLWRIPAFQVFLERMAKGASSSQHLGAYGVLLTLRQNPFSIFLGNGMIDTTTHGFLPGYCRLYYYYGVVGLVLVGSLLFYLVWYVKKEYRYMGILFLILCVSGTELFGIQVFLIVPFLELSEAVKEPKARPLWNLAEADGGGLWKKKGLY